MNAKSKIELLTRDMILGLLSDAEIAKVSLAEDAPSLTDGEQYVDLRDVAAGVQQALPARRIAPRHVVPKSAVSEASWAKIMRAVGG